MEIERLRALLMKYATDAISKEELDELLDEVAVSEAHPQLERLLVDMLEETEADNSLNVDAQGLYQRIVSHRSFSSREHVRHMRNWWWYGATAMLLLAMGVWLMDWRGLQDGYTENVFEVTRTVTTAPSDRPLLHLADGRLVDLDSVADGLLAIEDGIQITLQGDVLHYQGDLADVEETAPTNTIVIPKGRQYQIALPDGSKLWLNAASTVTYPIRFSKERREVEVAGEAYFEVKNATDWPFVVTTALQRIEVLGTHFNVSAYPDDAQIKTTLVEGRVNVSSIDSMGGLPLQNMILKPGQQVSSRIDRPRFIINSVDSEDVISWKEHLFVFSNEEISEVMKKVSRWYDVEIEYKDGMAGKRIGGSIPRLADVEELMEALKDTGLLRYEMKGGTIVVMK